MQTARPVTELLRAWSAGDEDALGRLIPIVEGELRRLARIYMARERIVHTLQTTALVNEAYVRLIDARQLNWQDRAHFLGIAARLMRHVLVDHARARGMQKRSGGAYAVPLNEEMAVSEAQNVDLLELDLALTALGKVEERKCRVIEMRSSEASPSKRRRRRCTCQRTPSSATGDWRSCGYCGSWRVGLRR